MAVPLRIALGKKKVSSFILNLNVYRNCHPRQLAAAKVAYTEKVMPLLAHLPEFSTVRLVYTLWQPTHLKCDIANPCSIIDKFVSDALVEAGKLEDDDYTFVQGVDYRFGGVDKENPRCVVSIIPTGPLKRETMKTVTIFDHNDIRQALLNYAALTVPEGHDALVNLDPDFEIQVEILPSGSAVGTKPLGLADKVTTARRTRGPNKAKETAADAPKTEAQAQPSASTEKPAAVDPAVPGGVKEDLPFVPDASKEDKQPEPEKPETAEQQAAQAATAQRKSLFTAGAGAGQGQQQAPAGTMVDDDGLRPGPNGPAAGGNEQVGGAPASDAPAVPRKSLFGNLGAVTNS